MFGDRPGDHFWSGSTWSRQPCCLLAFTSSSFSCLRWSPLHASDERMRVVGIVPFPDADRTLLDRRSLDAQTRPGWVNDRMWDELVFRAHDEPWMGEHVNRRTRLLTVGQVSNLVVYFVNDTDDPTFESTTARRAWNVAFFNLLHAMTGTIWIGEITDGQTVRCPMAISTDALDRPMSSRGRTLSRSLTHGPTPSQTARSPSGPTRRL